MKSFLIIILLFWTSCAEAQSFFWLGSTGAQSGQWITDAPADAAAAGFAPLAFRPDMPRSFLITGCKVIAWPDTNKVALNGQLVYNVNLSLAIDYGSIGYTSGDPNIVGRQVGANFSHNDTICVQGFEWGKFQDSNQFPNPKPFNRDALDRLWLTLGANVPIAFIYFQISYIPAPGGTP